MLFGVGVSCRILYSVVSYLYTMRQKFSNFFNPIFFMIKYAKVFDIRL